MKSIRIILTVTVAAAALLAQGFFPSSAAAPVAAPHTATCDRPAATSVSDAYVVTSTASPPQQSACTLH